MTESPVAGTLAGTVVIRSADLHVQGRTGVAGDSVPRPGELAVFCRPAVTAPALARRDGTVLAGAWLPDLVRLAGMMVFAADGMLVNLADTPANRAMSGSTGTADDSALAWPGFQDRQVQAGRRAGRP
jgi:hypothetical protein